jgi:hypothetical protein
METTKEMAITVATGVAIWITVDQTYKVASKVNQKRRQRKAKKAVQRMVTDLNIIGL